MLPRREELVARTAISTAFGKEGGRRESPRLSDAQAVDQAAAMVERLHGMFLKTLEALQGLRRGAPRVVVRRAGQVNVGGPQVNVAARGR